MLSNMWKYANKSEFLHMQHTFLICYFENVIICGKISDMWFFLQNTHNQHPYFVSSVTILKHVYTADDVMKMLLLVWGLIIVLLLVSVRYQYRVRIWLGKSFFFAKHRLSLKIVLNVHTYVQVDIF